MWKCYAKEVDLLMQDVDMLGLHLGVVKSLSRLKILEMLQFNRVNATTTYCIWTLFMLFVW